LSPNVQPEPPARARARTGRAPSRAGRARERLGLLLQTVLVAVQVAWLTLVGWMGATMALLPAVLQGAPRGGRAERRALRMRLVPPVARLGVSEGAEGSAGR
jgi:hypothetical protein